MPLEKLERRQFMSKARSMLLERLGQRGGGYMGGPTGTGGYGMMSGRGPTAGESQAFNERKKNRALYGKYGRGGLERDKLASEERWRGMEDVGKTKRWGIRAGSQEETERIRQGGRATEQGIIQGAKDKRWTARYGTPTEDPITGGMIGSEGRERAEKYKFDREKLGKGYALKESEHELRREGKWGTRPQTREPKIFQEEYEDDVTKELSHRYITRGIDPATGQPIMIPLPKRDRWDAGTQTMEMRPGDPVPEMQRRGYRPEDDTSQRIQMFGGGQGGFTEFRHRSMKEYYNDQTPEAQEIMRNMSPREQEEFIMQIRRR